MKLKTAAAIALLIILALAPAATANNKAALDGHLSRTFLTWETSKWKAHSANPNDGLGGVGWYNPDQRSELCLFRTFQLPAGTFYYEGLPKPRVTTNAISNTRLLHVEENGIYGGLANDLCPLASADPDQFLGTSAFNVGLQPGFIQSSSICYNTFSMCSWNGASVKWTVFTCPWDKTEFGNGDILGTTQVNMPPLVKGGIAMLMDILFTDEDGNDRTGNPTIGSSLADCDELPSGVGKFNQTKRLSPSLGSLSSLNQTPMDEVVPVGVGTRYVISCLQYKYTKFPPNPDTPSGTNYTGSSHDYFLVLDGNDTAAEWADALIYHEQEPTKKGSERYKEKEPDAIAEQGLYDLTGSNDCPFDDEGLDVYVGVDKSDPLLGTIPRVIGP